MGAEANPSPKLACAPDRAGAKFRGDVDVGCGEAAISRWPNGDTHHSPGLDLSRRRGFGSGAEAAARPGQLRGGRRQFVYRL